MEKEKAPAKAEANARDVLTMRLPAEINTYTKEKAEKIGVSQNAFLMMMIDMGIKMYEANYYVNPRQ